MLAYKVVCATRSEGVRGKQVRPKGHAGRTRAPKCAGAKPAEPKAADRRPQDAKSTDKPATESKPTEPKAAEPTAVTPGEGTPAEAKPQPTPLMDPLPGETPQGHTPPTVEINRGNPTPAPPPRRQSPSPRLARSERSNNAGNVQRRVRESPESAEMKRCDGTSAGDRHRGIVSGWIVPQAATAAALRLYQAEDGRSRRVVIRPRCRRLTRARTACVRRSQTLMPACVHDHRVARAEHRVRRKSGCRSATTSGGGCHGSANGRIPQAAPELQLESKLGMVVGVVGDTSIDRSLMLNVVTPIRVDVLQGVDGQTMPITQSGTGETAEIARPPRGAEFTQFVISGSLRGPPRSPFDGIISTCSVICRRCVLDGVNVLGRLPASQGSRGCRAPVAMPARRARSSRRMRGAAGLGRRVFRGGRRRA